MLNNAKKDFYSNLVHENNKDPKKLWNTINKILHKKNPCL